MITDPPSERAKIFWQNRNEILGWLRTNQNVLDHPFQDEMTLPATLKIEIYGSLLSQRCKWTLPDQIEISTTIFPWLSIIDQPTLIRFCNVEENSLFPNYGTMGDFSDHHKVKKRVLSEIIKKPEAVSPDAFESILLVGQLQQGSRELSNYARAYIIYDLYSDHFRNAYALYFKTDELGRSHFDRVDKEFAKIYYRNDLHNTWSDLVYDHQFLSTFGSEALISFAILAGASFEHDTPNVGLAFEARCRDRLRELGFAARTTPQSGDFGADLIAERDGLVYVIQCKWSRGQVGVKAVQEATSAKKYYGADAAAVVTNNAFTTAALELAGANGVFLLLPDQLDRLGSLHV